MRATEPGSLAGCLRHASATTGVPNGITPMLSIDGTSLVFVTDANGVVASDQNYAFDVYVHDAPTVDAS